MSTSMLVSTNKVCQAICRIDNSFLSDSQNFYKISTGTMKSSSGSQIIQYIDLSQLTRDFQFIVQIYVNVG